MSTHPPPGPGGFGRNFEEAVERIEMELRQAVAYFNDAVIPEARRESLSAMRSAAEMLRKLADRFEAAGHSANPPAGPDPDSQQAHRREQDPRA